MKITSKSEADHTLTNLILKYPKLQEWYTIEIRIDNDHDRLRITDNDTTIAVSLSKIRNISEQKFSIDIWTDVTCITLYHNWKMLSTSILG